MYKSSLIALAYNQKQNCTWCSKAKHSLIVFLDTCLLVNLCMCSRCQFRPCYLAGTASSCDKLFVYSCLAFCLKETTYKNNNTTTRDRDKAIMSTQQHLLD